MERILRSGPNRVLYDPDRISEPDPAWFDPDHWEEENAILQRFGGRGEALAIEGPFGAAVLKVYRRGGFVRHFVRQQYLWSGLDRARSVREYRVLRTLFDLGLPVPEPLGARVLLLGPVYEAALLTRRLDGVRPLSEVGDGLDTEGWAQVDALIDRFAAAGLRHPDLNATNLLMTPDRTLWMVDFDRATVRSQPVDPAPMHARLARSLDKLGIRRG